MSAQIYDTLLWEYIKNPWDRWLSLDKLAERKFNYEMISFDDLVKKQKLSDFSEVNLKKAWQYSVEDVYITNKLFLQQEKDKIIENKVLKEIEIPLIKVLENIEITVILFIKK